MGEDLSRIRRNWTCLLLREAQRAAGSVSLRAGPVVQSCTKRPSLGRFGVA
jgi:hypothetical protein